MIERTDAGEDKMHGSIFVLLKRFIESRNDYSTWVRLTEEAGVGQPGYQMREMYPTRELFSLLNVATRLVNKTTYELLEQFGEFMIPDLLMIYDKYLQPEWRTYEMLLYTETVMHAAAKLEDPRMNPPRLHIARKGNNQLIIDYHSKRRMDAMALGMIKGIARYYNESDRVVVTRVTPAGEERVQIKVDFTD